MGGRKHGHKGTEGRCPRGGGGGGGRRLWTKDRGGDAPQNDRNAVRKGAGGGDRRWLGDNRRWLGDNRRWLGDNRRPLAGNREHSVLFVWRAVFSSFFPLADGLWIPISSLSFRQRPCLRAVYGPAFTGQYRITGHTASGSVCTLGVVGGRGASFNLLNSVRHLSIALSAQEVYANANLMSACLPSRCPS